jgi:hypothetical protein
MFAAWDPHLTHGEGGGRHGSGHDKLHDTSGGSVAGVALGLSARGRWDETEARGN